VGHRCVEKYLRPDLEILKLKMVSKFKSKTQVEISSTGLAYENIKE
jgi:hypothetical protein